MAPQFSLSQVPDKGCLPAVCPLLSSAGGPGGLGGGLGGPMEFGRSKSKFQEVPETGVLFTDVAVSLLPALSC
jgi:hypothetical protein